MEEGNAGTTALVFTASLSAASGKQITVAYTTVDDTATTADGDYVATSGILTFAPGVTTQLVTVLVNGDTKSESDETFILQLSNALNASIGLDGIGTIENDDAPPTVAIDDTPVTAFEGDEGTTDFVFTVNLSNASGTTVTVEYSTSDLTAEAGSDYTAASGTLTFAPGRNNSVHYRLGQRRHRQGTKRIVPGLALQSHQRHAGHQRRSRPGKHHQR